MKTIIVTGASRGIGLAITQKFLAEGWFVVGTYNKTTVPINHKNFIPILLDQNSVASIDQGVKKIKEIAPHIDVLVNNAGVNLEGADLTIDVEKIRKTFEVNVFGLVDVTERLLSVVFEKSHIINIDSNYGSFSTPIDDETSTGYRMSKAALNMYTRSLAFRLSKKGVIVSSFDPGWVKTDMGYAVSSDDEKPNREPEEVAQDVLNLVTTVTESGCFWRFGKKREW